MPKREQPSAVVHGAALALAAEWLRSEQPEDAIISQFGMTVPVGDFTMMVAPGEPANPTRRGGVVIVFNFPTEYDDLGDVANGYTEREVAALRHLVGDYLGEVVDQWNGVGCTTLSFHVAADVHPSVTAARARYRGLDPVWGRPRFDTAPLDRLERTPASTAPKGPDPQTPEAPDG